MSTEKKSTFIHDDFLLDSGQARVLYHDYARDMPILDYHNHLSAQQIAENEPLGDISSAWLGGDHYKWRAMRAHGIQEKYITGEADKKEKFMKWAETVPHTLRNPLFHWTHMELKRYFDLDLFLSPETAQWVYEQANEQLESLTPLQVFRNMNVKVVCTTNDPTEDLRFHKAIGERGQETKVLPTFRSDALFMIEDPRFPGYVSSLGRAADVSIHSFDDFVSAIDQRIGYFHEQGCRLSDFGLGGRMRLVEFGMDEVRAIFQKALDQMYIGNEEKDKFRSWMFLHLAHSYHERSWVQQYHLGALRNNNSRLIEILGSDAGCDSIGDHRTAGFLSALFDRLDRDGHLSKTIIYNLNPADNEVFATMCGNFNDGSIPGKIQWGSAWWFLDQEHGMRKQLNTLSSMGLLSHFIGMLTDSRSLLSFPRHEYFRRVLCNLLGEDMKTGRLPNDMDWIGSLVRDVCYYNAHRYFRFRD